VIGFREQRGLAHISQGPVKADHVKFVNAGEVKGARINSFP